MTYEPPKSKFEKQLENVLGIIDSLPNDTNDADMNHEDLESTERSPMEMVVYEPVSTAVEVSELSTPQEKDKIDDYQYARTIYRGVLERGVTALEDILYIAKESSHPRAFDTISSLMKTIADVNKDMMALHKESVTKTGNQPKEVIQKNTQVNNYYSGTPEQENKDINSLLDTLGSEGFSEEE